MAGAHALAHLWEKPDHADECTIVGLAGKRAVAFQREVRGDVPRPPFAHEQIDAAGVLPGPEPMLIAPAEARRALPGQALAVTGGKLDGIGFARNLIPQRAEIPAPVLRADRANAAQGVSNTGVVVTIFQAGRGANAETGSPAQRRFSLKSAEAAGPNRLGSGHLQLPIALQIQAQGHRVTETVTMKDGIAWRATAVTIAPVGDGRRLANAISKFMLPLGEQTRIEKEGKLNGFHPAHVVGDPQHDIVGAAGEKKVAQVVPAGLQIQ